MEEPVKGWLHKTRKGMMMKAAQRHRRWFVLEGTTLSWYVDDSETAETPDAKGSIDVRGATVSVECLGVKATKAGTLAKAITVSTRRIFILIVVGVGFVGGVVGLSRCLY